MIPELLTSVSSAVVWVHRGFAHRDPVISGSVTFQATGYLQTLPLFDHPRLTLDAGTPNLRAASQPLQWELVERGQQLPVCALIRCHTPEGWLLAVKDTGGVYPPAYLIHPSWVDISIVAGTLSLSAETDA